MSASVSINSSCAVGSVKSSVRCSRATLSATSSTSVRTITKSRSVPPIASSPWLSSQTVRTNHEPWDRDMTIKRMNHISVVVDDLAAAIAFFTTLGMALEGEMPVEGPWVDRRTHRRGGPVRGRVQALLHARPRWHHRRAGRGTRLTRPTPSSVHRRRLILARLVFMRVHTCH